MGLGLGVRALTLTLTLNLTLTLTRHGLIGGLFLSFHHCTRALVLAG